MFFNTYVLLYSVLFLIGLEIAILVPSIKFFLMGIILLLTILATRQIGEHWVLILIPSVFVITVLFLQALIDPKIEKQLFAFACFIVYYILLFGSFRLKNYEKDQTAHGLMVAGLMTTMFLYFSTATGVYINIISEENTLGSVILFAIINSIVVIVTIFQYFYIIAPYDKRKDIITFTLILGIAIAEISLISAMLPFRYLTIGVIILIFYYILWDLMQSMFLSTLEKKRVFINLIFFGILLLFILASANISS